LRESNIGQATTRRIVGVKITIDAHVVITIPGVAVRAYLKIGGILPAGQINVDTTNETVTVQFVDDHNDPVDAPEGASVTFTSSDESVATVAPSADNPWEGDISVVDMGETDIGADLAGATAPSGEAITVEPVTVTVEAGPAAGASLVLSEGSSDDQPTVPDDSGDVPVDDTGDGGDTATV
jgi:hypothetical protein